MIGYRTQTSLDIQNDFRQLMEGYNGGNGTSTHDKIEQLSGYENMDYGVATYSATAAVNTFAL